MDDIKNFDFDSLKFDKETNAKIKRLVMAHINGDVTLAQIRKFIAQNEVRFSKLAALSKNNSAETTRAKSQPVKASIIAGKKKTPWQQNGISRRVK